MARLLRLLRTKVQELFEFPLVIGSTMFANFSAYFLCFTLVVLSIGSLLTLSSSPHWFIRGWDFPRLQIVAIAWIATGLYFAFRYATTLDGTLFPWLFVSLTLFMTAWHGYHIVPYTPLFATQAKTSEHANSAKLSYDQSSVRIVISNVEEENDQYELWMQTIQTADPDILVVLEIDELWVRSVKRVIEKYPYSVIHPQNNWYGMMMLSRLPIETHEVRFMVQEDVPSIDAEIRLKDHTLLRMIGVHPRPPEPIRGNDSTARDAELTLWGQELESESRPVIICGDLNDVAWSHTTRMFLRTCGLLDPRRGRGFYNTFNANHFFLRFPVDHVFVSPHFTICGIERLSYIGSDHFPICIDLRFEPEERSEQNVLEKHESDDEDSNLRIERAIEDPEMNGDEIQRERERKQPLRAANTPSE